MSVWRVGTENIGPVAAFSGGGQSQFKTFVDRLTKWIPGDVLALYVAGVTVLSSEGGQGPSVTFLIIMAIVTPMIVVLADFAARTSVGLTTFTKAGLALLAFLIWTLTVPESGWQRSEYIAENAGIIAVISGVAGLLFGLLAEGVAARLLPRGMPQVRSRQAPPGPAPGA